MISKERLEEQFWSKVNTTGKNDCWYLKKSRGNNQYGNVSWEGKSYRAHRVSWIIANGEIPEGMDICHICDHPGCVNPTHLFTGTQSDNAIDCVKKGRNPNSNKRFCSHGHEYTPENTRALNGRRYCRECGAIFAARLYTEYKEHK